MQEAQAKLLEDDDTTLTPGERIQQAFVEGGTAAEGRTARQNKAAKRARRTPIAKKIARNSRGAKKAKAH
jgi:hypothetical protein